MIKHLVVLSKMFKRFTQLFWSNKIIFWSVSS